MGTDVDRGSRTVVHDAQGRLVAPVELAGLEVGQDLAVLTPGMSFAEVLLRFSQRCLHRAYVVDQDLHVMGVVTITDILTLVTKT